MIFSADADRLADFYQRVLNLSGRHEHPGHRGFQVGPTYLGFDDPRPGTPLTPGPVTVWVTVDDLDGTVDRCRALGARVLSEPSERPWGARLASVADPDGNTLGLSQRR